MDKAERSTLLRSCFKAIGGVPYVGKGVRPKPQREPRGKVYMPWPEATPEHKRRWYFPDRERGVRLAPKRVARASPLMRIAAHYPKRLPRILSPN